MSGSTQWSITDNDRQRQEVPSGQLQTLPGSPQWAITFGNFGTALREFWDRMACPNIPDGNLGTCDGNFGTFRELRDTGSGIFGTPPAGIMGRHPYPHKSDGNREFWDTWQGYLLKYVFGP